MILGTIAFLFSGLSCPQNNNSTITPGEKTATVETAEKDYFPFTIHDDGGVYSISAAIESPELYPKYTDFFEKNGYTGNGVTWEGHIIQILEELNPELIPHIFFDPEAGSFFATADSKESQLKFVEILNPIFSDLTKLEEYVKKAERERISD